jgi:hypothetical protein
MFNSQTIEDARKRRGEILEEYADSCESAMKILDDGFEDAMAVMALPKKYRLVLRTTNLIERENEEVRRRECIIHRSLASFSEARCYGLTIPIVSTPLFALDSLISPQDRFFHAKMILGACLSKKSQCMIALINTAK